MLNKENVLFWNEIEHDLYEENGYIFGIELDLFNGHQVYYAKSTDKNGTTYYCDLSGDIYEAIKEFNKIVEKNWWCK